MKLVLMSDSEFNQWYSRSVLNYAADKKKAMGISQHEADKIATDSFRELLPLGIKSKDNFLYSAKNDEQNILGFVWFGIRNENNRKRAFVYDVMIEEKYRGKGYGRQMMVLLEIEIKKQGLDRVGLHVFGYNEVAIRLYSSIGYTTTDISMEKDLTVKN